MGLQAEDVWRALADHGPATAERIASRTGSELRGVLGYLHDDLHYERATAYKEPDGTMVYTLTSLGERALDHARAFSLMLDYLEDEVSPTQPWAIARELGEELETVSALVEHGLQGRWVETAEDGGVVITERGRRKLEIDRAVGRLAPAL